MVRTLVNLDEKQKKWLDSLAKEKGVPMAYLVREAVAEYMIHGGQPKPKQPDLKELVKLTAGTWKGEDGLRYQLKMRKEWDR